MHRVRSHSTGHRPAAIFRLLSLIGLVVAAAGVLPAAATTLTVTNLNDSGAGSLRQSIINAVTDDSIVFAPGLAGTLTLTSGQLTIGRNLTITGPCARELTISGNGASRIFNIAPANVTISGLTLTAGLAAGIDGAGANPGDGQAGGTGLGGAIYAIGGLNLLYCNVTNSIARGGTGGAGTGHGGAGGTAGGGGIFSSGHLTIRGCTFRGNQAQGGFGGSGTSGGTGGVGGDCYGGALHCAGSNALVFIYSSTFEENFSFGGTGGSYMNTNLGGAGVGYAGGLSATSYGLLVFSSSTVARNIAYGGYPGGASNEQGPGTCGGVGAFTTSEVHFRNTIVCYDVATTAPDVNGIFTSDGHNIVGKTDGGTGWVGTDYTGTVAAPLDPQLGPVQDNGGPTATSEPFAGSPAIDHADLNAEIVDQRGRSRVDDFAIANSPDGNGADIGAFEVWPRPTTLVVTNAGDCGVGTLRQALVDAAPNDSVRFRMVPDSVITLTSGEIAVHRPVVLAGPADAPGVTISGNDVSRVLHVFGGPLTLIHLTISHGSTTGPGAGALVETGGAMNLIASLVTANNSGNSGGGLANNGTLVLNTCTVTDNNANSGAGLYNYAGSATLLNCTFAYNYAYQQGGGVYSYNVGGTSTTLKSTILGYNGSSIGASDARGVFSSSGYNLIEAAESSIGLTNGVNHDQVGSTASVIDPRLGIALAANGGPTRTLSLYPCSPAVDQGLSNGTFSNDQRDLARIVDDPVIPNAGGGDGSDIGAYELKAIPPTLVMNLNDSGAGSLRQAVLGANCGRTIGFVDGLSGAIHLTSGELQVGIPMFIVGPRATSIQIDGNNAGRVFHIIAGGALSLSNLTIQHGSINGPGAAAFVETGGALTMDDCLIADNVAPNSGGGIALNGTLVARNCTFENNSGASGGALYNYAGTATLTNCTVAANSATSAGGGLYNYPVAGTITTLASTLVASNTSPSGPDLKGAFQTSGYNLIGKMDANASGPSNGANHDQVGTISPGINPQLGSIASNGGPTKTVALLAGSPAIDKGRTFGFGGPANYDQRGAARIYDDPTITNGLDGCDVGAYEAGPGGVVDAGSEAVPRQSRISAITPNPSRDAATIAFALSTAGRAELIVFDVSGRRIRTLSDGPRLPGEYSVAWDGTDDRGERVASGILFVRLVSPAGVITRTLVHLR